MTIEEFNLLIAFLHAPREALSRERLLFASRVHSEEIVDRSLDPIISRLRRRVEKDHANPALIKTVRGSGYVLERDVKVDERPRPDIQRPLRFSLTIERQARTGRGTLVLAQGEPDWSDARLPLRCP